MVKQRKNILLVLILLLLIFLLEVVVFYETKTALKMCYFPCFTPVISIVIVPASTFIIGMKCGEISNPEKRNNLFQEKNKLVKRIFNVLIILFCLMSVYVGMITIGRIIDFCCAELSVIQNLNDYSRLYIELYAFTRSELYVFVIILTATLGVFKSFTGDNQ